MHASHDPPRPHRRQRRLLLAGLLLSVATLWLWLFVVNFDLDQYREQIADEASRQLQLPVRIGHARLEFREAGIACRLSDVTVGTPQTDRELKARTIWLQLAWRGVIRRQPIFTEIAMNEPHLRMAIDTVPPVGPPPPPPPDTEPDWLDELGIHRIEVYHGSLELSWPAVGHPAGKSVSLHAVKLEVDNLAKGKQIPFSLSGELSDDPARPERISLKGSVELPAGKPMSVGAWNMSLDASRVEVAPLLALLPDSYALQGSGTADLAVTLHGTAASQATVQAHLTGRRLQLRPGNAYRQARALKEVKIAGEWQRTATGQTFSNLRAQLDDARLTGDVTVSDGDEQRNVHLRLATGSLPLATLLPWLPEQLQQDTPLLRRLHPQGELSVETAELKARLPNTPGRHPSLQVQTFKGLARQLEWALSDEVPLEVTRLPIAFADGHWLITQAEIRLGELPVQLSGAVTLQEETPLNLNLELHTEGEAGNFVRLAGHKLPDGLTLGGAIGLHGHLQGPVDALALALTADLSRLQGRYGESFTLPATAAATWTAQGNLTPERLLLLHSDLDFPPLRGSLHGDIDWSGEAVLNLQGAFALDDLTSLYPHLPALADSGIHGGAALDLKVEGPLKEPEWGGSLSLNGVGMPMHGIIADIAAVRGRLLFDRRHLQGEGVTALLGRSPVALRVNLPDLAHPRLDLKVEAAAVRADELIFRSDTRMLRDLNGRLLIDGDGIAFAPVHVSLDQGTRATIHGSVTDFAAPRVDLSISGDYANVGEIIALWTDESPAAHAARLARHAGSPPAPQPRIRIEVNAKGGDLFGMKFSEARTLIVPTDRHLLLHPLDFKVEDGYCSTQVLVDYSRERPLLRVSGHAENIDAYQIYNELLGRKSILRGTLRGDFYLQGELGETGSQRFLTTSFGNIRFSVRDGVMRHSPLLGTLFSILNVSQLFQGKLPDVSREGVPFTLLTAEMSLDKGILHSNELVMKSNALDMSYLGQYNMLDDQLDLLVVAKPLGTIDTVVSHLPVAGWILTGEERTLLTAQFKVTGSGNEPKVEAIPITTLSKGILGIIQRTLSLPYKLVTDPAILWGKGGEKQ